MNAKALLLVAICFVFFVAIIEIINCNVTTSAVDLQNQKSRPKHQLLIALAAQSSSNSSGPETADTDDDGICQTMVNSGATGISGILTVGELTGHRLLIITRNFLVYELPLKYLAKQLDKVYINHTTPTPIATKWPGLVAYADYEFVAAHVYNAFIWVSESGVNYLFLTIQDSIYKEKAGIIYNIDTGQAQPGLNYMGTDENRLLSTYRSSLFYGLYRGGSGPDAPLMMCTYSRRSTDPNNPSTWIDPSSSDYYPVCVVQQNGNNATSLMVQRDSSAPCQSPPWPVLSGFVSKGKFYLFGPNYVISFAVEAWTVPSSSVPFEKQEYGKFIQCGGVVPKNLPNDGNDPLAGRADPPLGVAAIIAIVLLLLLVLLCCCLFLARVAQQKQQKKKKDKEKPKKKSKRSASALASARSGRSAAGSQVKLTRIETSGQQLPQPSMRSGRSAQGGSQAKLTRIDQQGASQVSHRVTNRSSLKGSSAVRVARGSGSKQNLLGQTRASVKNTIRTSR